jgi:hypothetical protein
MTFVTLGNAYEIRVFFSLRLADETCIFQITTSNILNFCGDSCHGGTKPKQQVSFLLEWKVDGSNKVPPLLTGRYRRLHCFENVRKLPTECDANTNSWINNDI